MNCFKETESIKYWAFDGCYCTKCFFKRMRHEMLNALSIMTEEEIQDLFGSDYYGEVTKTIERMDKGWK